MNRNFLEEFINIFESQPSLWKMNSEIYKNKNEKVKSLNILLTKYLEVDRNATVEMVKNNINNLRTTYRRELLKVLRSEKSGAGADDIYAPSLWYFDLLHFLRDQEEQAHSFSTMDNLELETTPVKKKKNCEAEDNFLKEVTDFLARASNETRDEAQVFGESWTFMYRNMDVMQQLYAKRLVDDVLMNGRLGLLSPLSSINFGGQAVYAQGMNNIIQPQYLANLPLQIRQPSTSDSPSPSSISSMYSFSPQSNS